MTSAVAKPDVEAILNRLKPFQRDTVEYVFKRLYDKAEPARRFLVADEVGLGKTMVARGVVAKAIDHLWDEIRRIDIVYICSNSDIARQNINRLNITEQRDFAHASRITLLPITLHNLDRKLNFISFTPSTSFNLRSAMGVRKERALLFWMLRDAWELDEKQALNVLQGSIENHKRWRRFVRERLFGGDVPNIDPNLNAAFVADLEKEAASAARSGEWSLRERFEALCEHFQRPRAHARLSDDLRAERVAVIGALREQLARTCLNALEPDLVILDEFQRFKDLLSDDSEAGQLAGELFSYADELSEVRTLLLSATPYKMYTLHSESEDEDHYRDFLKTIEFLETDAERSSQFSRLIKEYRHALYRLVDDDQQAAIETKQALEQALRRIMVRTERSVATESLDDMLKEVPCDGLALTAADTRRFLSLQHLARVLDVGEVTEYWKSANYLLNFMDSSQLSYRLKEEFKVALLDERASDVARVLREDDNLLLSYESVRAYQQLDPVNARITQLIGEVRESKLWRMLWLPPTARYYQLGGVYADADPRKTTKRLIFSSWKIVPRVVSALVSYEAERLMFRSFEDEPVNTPEARKRHSALLRFEAKEGRLTGMPVLALFYPSVSLARLGDPLSIWNELGSAKHSEPPKLDAVREAVRVRIERQLRPLLENARVDGREDESWYWAAPLLLDLEAAPEAARNWLARDELAGRWAGYDDEGNSEGEPSAWPAHVEAAQSILRDGRPQGAPPTDLLDVLVDLALAGPGVVALRALSRVLEGEQGDYSDPGLRDQSARLAWAFRKLFNQPEAMALIRGLGDHLPYWRLVLKYAVNGGLQAVLDEYIHLLRESRGVFDWGVEQAADEIVTVARDVLSMITSRSEWEEIRFRGKKIDPEFPRHTLRTHFALRFGQEKLDDESGETREEHVRDAFNSPFWPFVLASTSVGQEGLDFHTYCHAVVHWNLPANPVDLEQREGRVHRYKNHAVRKNVANKNVEVLATAKGDPWEAIFQAAESSSGPQGRGLVPYWNYPIAGGARIERHVPALPLSRDRQKLHALRRSLAVYRMVFGQARQEDLIEYLLEHLSEDKVKALSHLLQIRLAPPIMASDGINT